MGNVRFGRGSSEVTLDDAFDKLVNSTLDALIPRTKGVLEAEVSEIANEARLGWPVGKERRGKERGRPHSRDLIDSAIRIPDNDTVEGIVAVGADYGPKIKSAQNGLAGGSPFQILIRRPLKAADREIAEVIAEDLSKLIEQGG